MDNELYAATQNILMGAAATVATLPLDDFIEAIDRAEVVGPLVDPTLYKQSSETMGIIKTIAEAGRKFQKTVLETGIPVKIQETDDNGGKTG